VLAIAAMEGNVRNHDSSLLILLVGSNPLPNYLSACALRPRKIALVYTKETSDAKDRLKQELIQALGDATSFMEPDPFVEDATCATAVRRTLDGLIRLTGVDIAGAPGSSLLLNYTGGTKVMAAHARMAFMEQGGGPEHASYLDEGGEGRQPRLRFDDGRSKDLSEYSSVPLELKTILALHGITYKPRSSRDPAPTLADALEILCNVLSNVSLVEELYSEHERLKEPHNPKKLVSEPFRADHYSLQLSVSQIPTDGLLQLLANGEERKSWFKQWYDFIGGEWLEEWLGQQIQEVSLEPKPEVVVGVNAFRGEKQANLEVDVAVVRGHRSYFISCTTDTTKSLCKSKLFEVAIRSRHLGGDLARAALVCLADDKMVAALQTDIDDVWGASNTMRVFGFSDIRSWSCCGGKEPNRYSLKTWLES
jgi:hypothetical protein